MTQEKITPYQGTMILAGFFLGTSVIMNPAKSSGADAWFSELVGFSAGLILMGITGAIARLNPGKSLVEILVSCFGKTFGKILGLLFLLFSTWLSAAVLRIFSFYSNTENYSETPIVFITICYLAVIVLVVKLGLEILGRISEVLVILTILITMVTLFSFLTDFHPEAFLPLFQYGAAKPLTAGLKSGMLPYAEVFLALNFIPNVNNQKKTFQMLWCSVFVSGGVMLLFTIRNISVMGVEMASRNIFPSEKVFRLMPGFDVIPLLDINVVVTGVIKVSLTLFAQARILGDLFGVKNYKLFILPLSLLDLAVSIPQYSLLAHIFVATKILPFVYLPVLVLLPLLILIFSLVRKKKTEGIQKTPGS